MHGWAGMIKPEQIPDEVIKAAFNAAMLQPHNSHTGQMIAAVTAAINAWPGFKAAWFLPQGKVYILPAPWENPKPQEKNND